nr:MAG TPA: hypothetical protein [Caudoviricetes sp.]
MALVTISMLLPLRDFEFLIFLLFQEASIPWC